MTFRFTDCTLIWVATDDILCQCIPSDAFKCCWHLLAADDNECAGHGLRDAPAWGRTLHWSVVGLHLVCVPAGVSGQWEVGWSLEFYVLVASKVIRTDTTLWQCTLMMTPYWWAPLGDCWHHDLISYSVTLSWHWDNQSLPCPNNAELLD